MTESIETSESEAVAPTTVPRLSPRDQIIQDARFAVGNPDVLHTPTERRQILALAAFGFPFETAKAMLQRVAPQC